MPLIISSIIQISMQFNDLFNDINDILNDIKNCFLSRDFMRFLEILHDKEPQMSCFFLDTTFLMTLLKRMHSSRMRTARSSSHLGGGSLPPRSIHPPGAGSPPPREQAPPPGSRTPRSRHPPPPCEQND